MNVLVICDDIWHPGEVIVRGLKPLEKLGYELDFVMAAKDILTKDMLYDYDVIINAKGNAHSPANAGSPWFEDTVTAVMPNDFKEYIESGRGFIALHSGNTYHPETRMDMVELIGNEFLLQLSGQILLLPLLPDLAHGAFKAGALTAPTGGLVPMVFLRGLYPAEHLLLFPGSHDLPDRLRSCDLVHMASFLPVSAPAAYLGKR